jgi:hypothetical protein
MISEKFTQAEKVKSTKGKAKYILNDDKFFVEELAQKIYEKEGYFSLWSENDYWLTLFTLLFWDVIFAKLKGIWTPELGEFPNQYQDMPQDFFSNKFYEKRKNLFDNKIKELSHSDIKQRLQSSYRENYQKPCRSIENWDKFTIEELSIAIEKIEINKLLKILERLAKDFNGNRAGLPDLFIYSENEYFFAEVKGEKDKISKKQHLWHSFLSKELGFKVEIFMVNKKAGEKNSQTKIKSKQVKISFGKSTSKKRENAIEFIKQQPTFKQSQEKGDDIYSAIFDISDIENLFTILDFTSGWKTQKIEIDGEMWKSTELRDSLYCFRKKEKERKSMDYCRTNAWDGKKNKFQCHNFFFRELEDNFWDNYGYVDTQKEEWIFDKNAIQKEIEKQIKKLSLCPLFNEKKILKLAKNIPDFVNPKVNTKWGFIDNDRKIWFWKQNKWQSQWNDDSFPGVSMMIGVKKLEKDDISDSLDYENSVSTELDVNNSEYKSIYNNDKKEVSKKYWFKTWWGVILTILFYPILVPYLVWTKTQWNLFIKIGITIFVFVIC